MENEEGLRNTLATLSYIYSVIKDHKYESGELQRGWNAMRFLEDGMKGIEAKLEKKVELDVATDKLRDDLIREIKAKLEVKSE